MLKSAIAVNFLCCFIFWGCTSSPKKQTAQNQRETINDTLPLKEFIFSENQPFKQCHASTLLHLPDGRFLVAWFGGTKEKNDDVGIWLSKGRPGEWSKPAQVAKIRNDAHWNPVLFRSKQGTIYLFFKVAKEIDDWETWVQTSNDDGQSWSVAKELIPNDKGGRGPVKNKPIILSDGSWLAGASHEKNRCHVFVDRSIDNGETWTAMPYIEFGDTSLIDACVIQPTLWESTPGNVHMLARSGAGAICRSDSKDYGKTWTALTKTNLPNPNSGIDLTKLPGGVLALAYNPDTIDYGARAPLLLALSYDNGKTWPDQLTIEAGNKDDEFSYPAVISFGDTIAMTYTWQRKNIAFWMGTSDAIRKNKLH